MLISTSRKKMRYASISVLYLTMIALILSSCGANNSVPAATGESKSDVQLILDAKKIYRISDKEMIDLLGEPELKEEWNFSSLNEKEYKATTYTYDDGSQELLSIDGKIVRFTYFANDKEYTTDDDLFRSFGISASGDMKKTDTGGAIKFNSVADKVPEVWVTILDNKIDNVKITYDLRYF